MRLFGETTIAVICKSLFTFALHTAFGPEMAWSTENIYKGMIPDGYNANNLPLQSLGLSTPVFVSAGVIAIDEIREDKMEFSIQLFIIDIWKDPRLNFSGILSKEKFPTLPEDLVQRLWIPKLAFFNIKYGSLHTLFSNNVFFNVRSGEYIARHTRLSATFTCTMDLHYYPMDSQRCFLVLSTLSTPNNLLELKWCDEDIKLKAFGLKRLRDPSGLQTVKYDIKDVYTTQHIFMGSTGNYTNLLVNFLFIRRLSRHIFNIYVPSSLIVFISFMSCWLDCSAVPARIALGLTSLLTLVTQATQSHSQLPPISYMTAMDIWFFVCIVLVFMSLVEYAWVYNVSRQEQVRISATKPQLFQRRIRSGCKSADCKLKCCLALPRRCQMDLITKTSHPHPLPPTPRLDKISRYGFPILFTLFACSYFIYFGNV